MDLRNLCSKLDVDALRAKIPPFPQIKLPKSISKLKSRKIFRSSRGDVNSIKRRVSSNRTTTNSDNLPVSLGAQYTIPPSEIINRTPNRISTISSLMNKRGDGGGFSTNWQFRNNEEEHFYHSAGGIEDYYPPPLNERFEKIISRPISPIRAPAITQEFHGQSEENLKMSFGERLQKGYKDVTEFKIKHLFAKKTVVRTDGIEIIEYIHRFDEDRKRDEYVQQKIDRDIADNYKFQFKVAREKSEELYVDSPASTTQNIKGKKNHKTVSELSGDESGMESSPPPRKPGIAATRFSRVRRTPLNMSLEEDNNENDEIHVIEEDLCKIHSEKSSRKFEKKAGSYKLPAVDHTPLNIYEEEDDHNDSNDDIELDITDENSPKIKHNASSLYDIKKNQAPEKAKSMKDRMTRLSKQKSESDEKKRKAPLTPQQSEEKEGDSSAATTKSDKPFETIKQNFKRIQKSIKLPNRTQLTTESANDEANSDNKTISSRTQQFTERMKRFRSSDQVNMNPEEDENKESPIHKISNKLQEWKKSIKRKVDMHNTDNEDANEGGSPQRPVGSLMKKIRHIRSRKHDSTDDPDDDEEGGETYKESLGARAKLQLEKGVVAASQVPQKTMKKISETKKYFKKKPVNDKDKADKTQTDDEELEEDEQTNAPTKPMPRPLPPRPPPIPRSHLQNSSEEEDSEDKQIFIAKSIAESQLIAVPKARAAWTTKSILSDDETDYDDEFPRVLLHQDNSDVFESTLIIAVTRPISHATTPIITELPPDSTEESTPDTKPDNWIPSQSMAASSLEMTPPLKRKLSKDSNETFSSRGHSRKHSIDSSSEDSWIKDIPRGPSTVPLNCLYESEEPWKIQKRNDENKLYKTKSIDLFEIQKKHGGVLTAFEDFDDELKNTPVVKIGVIQKTQKIEILRSTESCERESSEELENPDDDNSSRVTKISIHPPEINHNETGRIKSELKSQTYGNSRESLTGILDEKDVIDSGEEDDNEESESDIDGNRFHDDDHPPSKAPSPPPSISPTPPPLPQRQSSIILSKLSQLSLDLDCPSEAPPPLSLTKPPVPPNRPNPPPPKIPDRNTSTTRMAKPLVKTSSLRLAYSEQVNPKDVGKVNKLISRFEPEGPKQKPRVMPRKSWMTNESEEYSDEEDSFEIFPTKQIEKVRDTTPTNHPRLQKSFSIDSDNLTNNNENLSTSDIEIPKSLSLKATSHVILDNSECVTPVPSISITCSCLDVNSNFSQPSSVYGSPLPYPSSTIGSTEVTPLTNRKDSQHIGTRRNNRRSLARDDEHFYSFDSDEENSYYSLSSTSSNRYVVEL